MYECIFTIRNFMYNIVHTYVCGTLRKKSLSVNILQGNKQGYLECMRTMIIEDLLVYSNDDNIIRMREPFKKRPLHISK